jgi:hypothetical protein
MMRDALRHFLIQSAILVAQIIVGVPWGIGICGAFTFIAAVHLFLVWRNEA